MDETKPEANHDNLIYFRFNEPGNFGEKIAGKKKLFPKGSHERKNQEGSNGAGGDSKGFKAKLAVPEEVAHLPG